MANYSWDQTFLDLFDRCLSRYRRGDRDFTRYYTPEDLEFLADIGYKPRELFDFVEDFADGGDPSPSTALLVAAIRREYFLQVQHGITGTREMTAAELPARDAELDGIPWLPRLLQKARNKLRGENCPDIMYGCGGDRAFFSRYDLHPAEFLRLVWTAGENDQRVVEFVRTHR